MDSITIPKWFARSLNSLIISKNMKIINTINAITYTQSFSFNEKNFPVNPRSKSPHTMPTIASSASNTVFINITFILQIYKSCSKRNSNFEVVTKRKIFIYGLILRELCLKKYYLYLWNWLQQI